MTKLKLFFTLAIVIITLKLFIFQDFEFLYKRPLFVLQSTCECKKWEKIIVEENSNSEKDFSVFLIDTRTNQKAYLYNLDRNELESVNFTCDLYSEFRRGKDQKVLSFSLFGRNPRYYNKIGGIIKQVKSFYPDWTIRIYSDSNLNEAVKCKHECSPEDNVDFCNINRITTNPVHNSRRDQLNASYIIPTMWRFLPMGDSFVKFMLCRDSDSFIIQRKDYLSKREIDAVNNWLESGKLVHIMRDNPYHRDAILAGMWSLRLDLKAHKELVNKWWNKLIDRKIAKMYHPYRRNFKESDQIWLKHIVWPELKPSVALIHDSFNCNRSMGGEPWPSRRQGDCFVGSVWTCNKNAKHWRYICPVACRPKNHQNWTNC